MKRRFRFGTEAPEKLAAEAKKFIFVEIRHKHGKTKCSRLIACYKTEAYMTQSKAKAFQTYHF